MDTIDISNKKWFTQTVKALGAKSRRVPVLESEWENFPIGSKVLIIKIDDPPKKKYDQVIQQQEVNQVDTESKSNVD